MQPFNVGFTIQSFEWFSVHAPPLVSFDADCLVAGGWSLCIPLCPWTVGLNWGSYMTKHWSLVEYLSSSVLSCQTAGDSSMRSYWYREQ